MKRKKFNTIYLLLASMTIVLMYSCKDKDPTKPGYQRKAPSPVYLIYRLGPARDYMWFNPGSYWIYKNTKNNELDTVRLISFYYSTYYKWSYEDNTSYFNPNSTPIRGYFYPINRLVSGEGLIGAFFYPFDKSGVAGTGSSQTKFKELFTTMTLNNQTYLEVAQFETDSDDIWYSDTTSNLIRYPKTRYYWAKNVGLVKRENVSENYSWELIEHHIIK
jgi:hypothetical protein